LSERCAGLLASAHQLHLYTVMIAFCRELIKVAPVNLQPTYHLKLADALITLVRLDEAEELLHEAVSLCRREGLPMVNVS
jgi:hypothetical protein